MVNPVPGATVGTPWHRQSSGLWATCGWHTGVDYPAAAGTPVVAARPGHLVHVDYGASFGPYQAAVRCADGSEDFYAHMASRIPAGQDVAAGERIGTVGSLGNSTGPHLHFERHTGYGWSCSLMTDPAPSINYQEDDMPLTDKEIERIAELSAKKVWGWLIKDQLDGGERKSADTILMNIRARQE